MPPPAGYSDFYELVLEINYNNSPTPYLQNAQVLGQPPEERQAGWTETYGLYLPTPPSGTNLPIQNAYQLVQARAALLGVNYYIKKRICHQASVFKSSWPMAGAARFPIWDEEAEYQGSNDPNTTNQESSSPEEAILLRMEAGSLRRWEHMVRGIKDYLSDDSMTYMAATSYADAATFATTSMFDSLQQAIPIPGLAGAANATCTVTNTNGSISSPVIVSGGNFPGVANGTYYCYFYSANGFNVPALGTVTITAGVASAPTILGNREGNGYTGTSVFIPVSNDCNAAGTSIYGLPNYLPVSTLWANFLSCVISFTQSGATERIAQGTYTDPVPTFPSGLVPAIVDSPVKCNRSMIQRVANRQTGQIRLTKPARVRRGI